MKERLLEEIAEIIINNNYELIKPDSIRINKGSILLINGIIIKRKKGKLRINTIPSIKYLIMKIGMFFRLMKGTSLNSRKKNTSLINLYDDYYIIVRKSRKLDDKKEIKYCFLCKKKVSLHDFMYHNNFYQYLENERINLKNRIKWKFNKKILCSVCENFLLANGISKKRLKKWNKTLKSERKCFICKNEVSFHNFYNSFFPSDSKKGIYNLNFGDGRLNQIWKLKKELICPICFPLLTCPICKKRNEIKIIKKIIKGKMRKEKKISKKFSELYQNKDNKYKCRILCCSCAEDFFSEIP